MPAYSGKTSTVYQIDRFLGGGTEGKVYTLLNQPDAVAKIFESTYRTPDREKKLLALQQNPVPAAGCFPQDVLYDNGNFVGYTMPMATGNSIDLVRSDQFDPQFGNPYTLEFRVETAIALCDVFLAVHKAGYIIGDLNATNILIEVDPSSANYGKVVLIDVDSFHIDNSMRCVVARPEYAPPELIPLIPKLATAPLPTFTGETDCFGLAVHIFWLLMVVNPFQNAKMNPLAKMPSDTDAILQGLTPFFVRHPDFGMPIAAQPLSILSADMHSIFYQAFVTGLKAPKNRPNINQLHDALVDFLAYVSANGTTQLLSPQQNPNWLQSMPRPQQLPLPGATPVTRPIAQQQAVARPAPQTPPPLITPPTRLAQPPPTAKPMPKQVSPTFFHPAQPPMFYPAMPSYSGFRSRLRGDFFMYFSNTLLPRFTGWRERRRFHDNHDDLEHQAASYKATRERLFERRQEKLLRNNLRKLKKAIQPLDAQWEEFEIQIAMMKTEVNASDGVTQAQKQAKLNELDQETAIKITDSRGRKRELDLAKIQRDREAICTKANVRIGKALALVESLHKTFGYRKDIYLRSLNRKQGTNPIELQWDITPKVVYLWNPANRPPYYD